MQNMQLDNQQVGRQLALLRTAKGLTQNDLGERVGVTYQAVSKWERGETLPDISLLPALADILETTIDNILLCGQRTVAFRGTVRVQDLREGLHCLKRMGELLGRYNIIYRYALQGIDEGMNTSIEGAFTDDFVFEAFLGESVLQSLQNGMYVDITDIKRNFKHAHFRDLICEQAKKYNIT